MRNIFVIQHARIFAIFHQINCQSGHLGNHDAAKRIGHARVRVGQDEGDGMGGDGEDFDFGEALLRHDMILLLMYAGRCIDGMIFYDVH
mmetsp:Transcript_25702/g.54295  ORF Transcript_25702/g.54295 Transcript_25702/m.54295 type:complete len:89 (-) Transcript_25702:239-505(-)